MTRILLNVLVAAALAVPVPVSGGEALRIKHVVSIYGGDNGVDFQKPEGAACRASVLIVGDTGNGRVLKYLVQDGMIKPAGEFKLSELPSPVRLQISSKGEIFALDGKQRRIVRMSPEGAFIGYVDPTGLPAPGAYVPRSFKMDPGDAVYMLDILSERVIVLDEAGKYVREIKFPADYGFISDLAVDSSGTVLLLDSVQRKIYTAPRNAQAFSPLTAQLKEYMLFPTSITADKKGAVYIVDQNGGSIVVLDLNGQVKGKYLGAGWKEGLLRYPSQMCIADNGDLAVADRENNRVQVFTVVQ